MPRSEVEGDLQRLAAQQPGLSVQRVPTSDGLTSALRLSAGGGSIQILVLITRDRLRIERLNLRRSQQAQRWASDAATSVSRQQLLQATRGLCDGIGAQ